MGVRCQSTGVVVMKKTKHDFLLFPQSSYPPFFVVV